VGLGNTEQSNAFNTQHCKMSVPFHRPNGKKKKTINVYPWSTVTSLSNFNSKSLLQEIGAYLGGVWKDEKFCKIGTFIYYTP